MRPVQMGGNEVKNIALATDERTMDPTASLLQTVSR